MTITTQQYSKLDEAYNYFNKHLFDNKLPDSIITLNAKGKTTGYLHYNKYKYKDGRSNLSELAFNPLEFESKDETEVYQTLVHEMVHLWQMIFGEPSRKTYHNREWAYKMIDLGLQPSSTGLPGGRITGQSMSDYVIEGGLFEKVCGAFILKEKRILINAVPEEEKEKKKRNKTREKFVCPSCQMQAWAKKTAKLACGNCIQPMIIEEE